jgi:hypothetical protein
MRPDIKKIREKYANTKTMAQKVLGDTKNLLNERPFGMDFEIYKEMRYYQSKLLHELTRREPNERVASLFRPTTPSTHKQQMVFNARLKKLEAEEAKQQKELVKNYSLLDSVFNFFRRLTGQNHEPKTA